ncbi:group III truncated hemoglobin [Nocardia elegans]|uniref:group III truncated hemoglobin n=1 Tax=Nocardia elegans TaxID=300029 RepID=UPI001E3EF493|nr:group III truncated hemoglobin [Nocardia elegans]
MTVPAGRADLTTREDIDALLRDFYGRALTDELLAEPFTELREAGLESHLPVMCDFWETVLFGTKSYRRSALAVHLRLHEHYPLTAAHFQRWLALWIETVEQRHSGPFAARAVLQAGRMARAMNRRITGDRSWGSGEPVLTPVRTRDRPASD